MAGNADRPRQVDKWMNALRRLNLCEKLYLYKLEVKGGAGDEADALSDAGSSQTTGMSGDENGGPGL